MPLETCASRNAPFLTGSRCVYYRSDKRPFVTTQERCQEGRSTACGYGKQLKHGWCRMFILTALKFSFYQTIHPQAAVPGVLVIFISAMVNAKRFLFAIGAFYQVLGLEFVPGC
ncbi:hypothetical protein NDU88_002431 [Pleurodeles waltl]|uniref:Uncharacterized protein n=1 Tax=Pleurodeles waltl TaxID=8319 RepID=A0AAV7NDP8_PLEWA|nr:hypothetical protein NDU88_002431 [Pleurodeles waltl]